MCRFVQAVSSSLIAARNVKRTIGKGTGRGMIPVISKLRKNLAQIEAVIQTNGCLLMQEVILTFGDEEDPWLGRGEPSMMEMMGLMSPPGVDGSELSGDRSVMDVIAGRFFRLQNTKEYIECMLLLLNKIMKIAHQHNFMPAFEEILRYVGTSLILCDVSTYPHPLSHSVLLWKRNA